MKKFPTIFLLTSTLLISACGEQNSSTGTFRDDESDDPRPYWVKELEKLEAPIKPLPCEGLRKDAGICKE